MADIKLDIDVNAAPVDRAIRLLDNLEAELRDVQRAEKAGLIGKERLTAETKRLNRQMDRLRSATGGSAKDFRAFEKSIYGSGKAMRQKEIAMQQAGYQLQDFIVQVQAGTNPLIAFSQQGSQLAGFFAGPWGAAIGLGIAALGGLGTALLGAKGKTKDLKGELEKLMNYVSEIDADMSNLIDMAFTGPLEKARREAVAVLGIFKEIESKKLKESIGENLLPIIELIGERQDEFQKLRTETAYIGKVKPEFVRSKDVREGLQNAEIFLANLNRLIGDTLKGSTDELGIRLQSVFLKLQESGYATEEITLAFKELLEQPAIAQQIVDQLAAKEKKFAAEKAERDKKLSEARAKRAAEDLILLNVQAEAEKALFDENAAYEKRVAAQKIKDDKILLNAQARAEKRLIDENLRYEKEQERIRQKERLDSIKEGQKEFLNTLNFQFSLVEDTLDKLKDSQDELNDSAEELGKRLGIGFEEALDIIRRAKAEATVDLDAFGGIGDFKYSVPTSFKPEEEQKSRVKDLLGELRKQLNVEEALIGKTEARQRVIQALGLDYEKYGKATINSLEAQINRTIMLQQAENKRIEELEKAKQQQKDIADTIAGSMGDAFMSIVDGTKSVKDAFRDMARYIIGRLYEILVVEQMVQSISGAIQGAMIGPVQGPMLPHANGNVFSNGSVVPYANGGVVGSPVYFPMAGGRTGLMGEAGPEAIMPLKRGKNGQLGVQAEGGGDITIHQNFNFAANGDESVKKIIAQQAPKIAQMTQQQIMDSRRRGGQMKAVFG